MEEIITKGIVINSHNVNDCDKIITIYSCDNGKINAKLKGVRKSTAKLKMAGQLFYFGEFELIKSNSMFIVKNCSVIDNFFELSKDYDVFSRAVFMCEIINAVMYNDLPSANTLLNIVRLLKVIDNKNCDIILTKFILLTLKDTGYELTFGVCENCKEVSQTLYLSAENGGFVCNKCSPINPNKLDYSILKIIEDTNIDKLNTINFEKYFLGNVISSLINFINYNFNINLKFKK